MGQALPILSLNHDCLIEQVLREAGLAVNDMLNREQDGRRVLRRSLAADEVNLLKLHGNMN
jgi:hypothetical protein